MSYADFLSAKAIIDPPTGLSELPDMPGALFDFQSDITRWALRRGRAAIFAGTGLGKTLMELSWANAIHEATGRDVLILAPLAVASQVVREGYKFGIRVKQCREQADVEPGITVTNYQKLEHFDPAAFEGVVLDESSILKALDGKTKTRLIEAFQATPYRLAATATPAPNDFMELGNHAEFLGVMSHTEMLSTFFVHDGGETQKWRLKGHAESEFWRWMGSWSVMLRSPADLGYDANEFDLPPLHQEQHLVSADGEAPEGMLFALEAQTLQERLAARRSSVPERCELAARIIIGSFSDKLAETSNGSLPCGRRNTQSGAEEKHKRTRSTETAETNKGMAKIEKSAGSTCANGMSATGSTLGKSGEKQQRSGTGAAESDTRKTRNTENAAKHQPGAETKKSGEIRGCGQLSVSARMSMTQSFPPKAAAVPSAAPGQATEAAFSPLTTATTQEESGASCAEDVIKDSASSETTPTSWRVQSSTYGSLVVEPWVVWCHLNAEQDELERRLGDLAISIRGTDSEERKERLHTDWLNGAAPVLLCKPSMFGHGLNWQHCSKTTFVGLSDSFEQVYQAVRRFWRFGQDKPVTVHYVASELEGAVVDNIRRKEQQAEHMAEQMVAHMADITSAELRGTKRRADPYEPQLNMQLPAWLNEYQEAV